MKKIILSFIFCLMPFFLFGQNPYVNEIHYDNDGGDVGEFIEVCVPTGFTGALSDVTLTLYNGNNCDVTGTPTTLDLFVVGGSDANCTYYTFSTSIQNGSPDGWALDVAGTVTEFLTYEGSCTAIDGPASGMTSTDIGAEEISTTAIGLSLQLVNGTWVGPLAETPGATNASGTTGCTDMAACNYDAAATIDDASCFSVGDSCDDGDAGTSGDVYVDCNTCEGIGGLTSCSTVACGDFEIVEVAVNSQGDTWSCSGDAWTANGFTGTAGETSDLWLVIGEYDLTGSTSLYLNLDAARSFTGSDLEVFYTTDYSSACPSDATWVSGGVISEPGTGLAIDLSGAAGNSAVYIAIQYLSGSAGGATAGWTVSNVSVSADVCPAVNAAVVSACTVTFDCPTEMANIGDACDDADATTENDAIQADCSCAGTAITFDCPTEMVNIGDACDDGDAGTTGDVIQSDCTCAGTSTAGCPGAFISEFGYDCDVSDGNEAVEVCVPNTFTGSLADLQLDLYNGSSSQLSVYSTITLDMFVAGADDGTNTYYSWVPGTGSAIQNGAPDGMALSYQGAACEFISYEGTLTAADGPAMGLTSTDVGVSQVGTTTCDETIQLVGGVWVNACATVGAVNSADACVEDCPGVGNIGDACDDGDAATENDLVLADCSCAGTVPTFDCPTEMVNFGDACDDGDAATIGDVIQGDCTCAGSIPGDCPGAFISEFGYDCDVSDGNEAVEVCVPNTFTGSLADLQLDLYNGSSSQLSVYSTITIDMFVTGADDGTNTYYSWVPGTGSAIQNGAPDGMALSYQGAACEFISYEGTLTAADGPAMGLTSTDVGVSQVGTTTCDETIQLVGGVWVNACATVGDANSDAACAEDCPGVGNIGDACDDMDATTENDVVQADCSCAGTAITFDCPIEMVNIGDACDDGDAATENDVISANCECAGTATGVSGCTDMNACNYDATATTDDGSCYLVGDVCDDGDPATSGDVYTDCATCAGTTIGPACEAYSVGDCGTPIEDFTGFDGSGFASSPAAGQLCSSAWTIDGTSDDYTAGGENTAGDFAKGTTTGGESSGGIYGYDDGAGDNAMWFQPTGGDLTPGSATMQVCNNSGASITDLEVAYDLIVLNDADRASSFNFAFSLDGVTFTAVPNLDYTSPELNDGSLTTNNQTYTIAGVNLADGDCIWIQWQIGEVSGSGSRDEFGLDNISVCPGTAAACESDAGNFPWGN